jgi:CspA family cold shock protein
MSATESTQSSVPIYQVKWFSKKTGFGFVRTSGGEDIFVHHSDISVDGFRYLKEGELITGEVTTFGDGKTKISNISSPMEGGQLMCQVESSARRRPRAPDEEENVPSSE